MMHSPQRPGQGTCIISKNIKQPCIQLRHGNGSDSIRRSNSKHYTSYLEATAAATVSYQRAAFGNSALGFTGTAANTLTSSLVIPSLQKHHKHH
jgi:hypothetical protein